MDMKRLNSFLFTSLATLSVVSCNKEEANVVETPAASEAKVWVEKK